MNTGLYGDRRVFMEDKRVCMQEGRVFTEGGRMLWREGGFFYLFAFILPLVMALCPNKLTTISIHKI